MTRRELYALLLGLVLAVIGDVLYERSRDVTTVEQVVARERTAVASAASVHADSDFAQQAAPIADARARYRALRDTFRIRDTLPAVHDTVLVRALAAADTVIRLDSVALASGTAAIAAHVVVESALRDELTLALRPRSVPRLGVTMTALYDPVTATPLASVAAGVRVIGSVSLVAVAFQKVRLGETPRVYFGLSVRL